MLALMREREAEIVQRQPGVDRQHPQRLCAGIEILVPLKDRDRYHIQCVEVVFLVRHNDLAASTDDKIDLIV